MLELEHNQSKTYTISPKYRKAAQILGTLRTDTPIQQGPAKNKLIRYSSVSDDGQS